MELTQENVEKLNVAKMPDALLCKGLLLDAIEAGDKLEAENERLKATIEDHLPDKREMVLRNLRKENAKLRCLALHLMKEFLSLKSKSLWAFFDSPAGRTMLSADEYERLRDKAWRISNHITHYRKAYRKLKAELKETTK